MSNITQNDLAAMFHSIPEPVPVVFRLYHNDDGSPICYTMEELPGNYIEVDATTYAIAPYNVRVINSQFTVIKPVVTVKKLQPSSNGIACDKRDVCIVVNADQPHTKWSIVTNETT